MPPPTKTPKQKEGLEQVRVNELFAKNLDEQKRWLKRAGVGTELGHRMTIELALDYVVVAWTYALQGKGWTPPNQS